MTVAHFEIFSLSEIKEILESLVIFFPALRHKKKPQSTGQKDSCQKCESDRLSVDTSSAGLLNFSRDSQPDKTAYHMFHSADMSNLYLK